MAGAAGHEVIIGIDLGTTNSLAAVCDAAGPRVLVGAGGATLTPSVVRYEALENVPSTTAGASDAPSTHTAPVRTVVGLQAKLGAPLHPATTIASVKRLMGRSMQDASGDTPFLSYRVEPGPRDSVRIRVPLPGRDALLLSPEEVSAEVLRAVKQSAEAALGAPVSKAVITVPAYFDDAQRQATRTAGRLAGLDVVRIVPEPTAAALAYGIGVRGAAGAAARTVCVFDLGGGTCDVSIVRLVPAQSEGDANFYQVLATSGDTRLGGDDIDHAIAAWCVQQWGREGVSLVPDDAAFRSELLAQAEAAKIALSASESATILVAREYSCVLTRATLHELMQPLLARAMKCCERAVRDAQRAGHLPTPPASTTTSPQPTPEPAPGLDAVILVGGATRSPIVRERVRAFFSIEPYTAIDPDCAVALGAAVQGAILSGAAGGSLLLDVIPLSLGIETVGGAVAKLIVRNSTIPSRATEMFSTSVDNQTAIRLSVYQGEREMAADCRKLAEFHVRGIPPMPAGVPQLEVAFVVDVNGVLNVSAVERRSGARASLQVVPHHGLSQADVERIERESVTHAREDMTRHRVVDLIANAKLDAHWIEQSLARHEKLLTPEEVGALRNALGALRGHITRAEADWRAADPDAFHKAKESLDQASMRLHEVAIAASLRAQVDGDRGAR